MSAMPQTSHEPSPSVRSGLASDVGRVRPHNEDAALAEGEVFLVADGMGGHAAGEVASGIVIDAMRELVGSSPSREGVISQLLEANRRILESAARHEERRGMGTTATGVVRVRDGDHEEWVVVNVGDSRTYHLQGGELMQVTVDHSEVQELTEAGVITAEEARVHPARNIVTRSLGTQHAHLADSWVLPLLPGERFVLCSDGLTGEVEDADIRDILQEHPDPQAAADALVRAAVEAGGRDNVTVVVVDLDDGGGPAPESRTREE